VLDVQDVVPHLRRLVLGDGPVAHGFDELVARWSGSADSYVKLVFLAEGVDYPQPLDLDEVRAMLPSEAWPVLRTYTLRRVDVEARHVWIDVVLHGDDGVAGPWAARARPGDTLHLRGPGGAYAPRSEADHHLLVGDESALPAIAVALEQLPPGARATVFCEVDDAAAELALPSPGDVDLRWLHRGGAAPGTTDLLDRAVRAWDWPDGRVQAFVHGESALLRTVRPYVRERVDRADLSVSAYWRRGETEEGFRRWKSTQDDAVIRPVG
jgi:NADPH-dependent ferric siderophore reductase